MKANGPAFPVLEVDENRQPYNLHQGMSLRDYFAAAALAHPYTQEADAVSHSSKTAAWAYALADAMLIERVKE